MVRLGMTCAALFALVWQGLGVGIAHAEEDMRTASSYLQGLRDRGYFDLADEFIEALRKDKATPPEFLVTIDYEQGRIKLDEASRTGDLGLRRELLDQARSRLAEFSKKNPDHPLASEALVQIARLLVERGHLAMLLREDTEDPKLKEAKLTEARTSFQQARDAYAKADEKLSAAYKTFPPHIPEDQKEKIKERDKTHLSMMDAQIQKAVVDYEEGQTYPAGSKERGEFLTKGLEQFEALYKQYRTQVAGLYARMWQAKCYEEQGQLGPALGIYNELLEHQAPELRPMQRQVAYFKIIAHGKRKEHALAVDLANVWLQQFNTPAEHRTNEGLGVQLELAKNILAQAPNATEKDNPAAIRRVVDVLGQVVRYASPHKSEALVLLKKYKPKAAANAENLSRMDYAELNDQADQAIASQEWDRAIQALKFAVLKADPLKDIDKANMARYKLAYCYYMNKQFYETNVLTEHLARRYPRFSMAPKASEIAMASLADAYNLHREIDRGSDLARLINIAEYAVKTWPDREEGDAARMTLGQVYQGTGQYAKAIEVYESVPAKSKRRVEAQGKVGASHWELSRSLRAKNNEKEADAEVVKALSNLNAALKTRKSAGTVASDPDLITNICDIAEINLSTGKAKEGLALLEPSVKAARTIGTSGPAFSRMMTLLLRAHISMGQIEKAQEDMAYLEEKGGGNNLAQLYYELGKLLETELAALKEKGDSATLAKRQADYLKFLQALANAKSGQTPQSLLWAGEQMLKIQNPREAGQLFGQILEKWGDNKEFLAQQGADQFVLQAKIGSVQALREQGDYTKAESMLAELTKQNPRTAALIFEQGMILERKAEAKEGSWKQAFAHWQNLAVRLGTSRPRPPQYYDAWYHAAYALNQDGLGTKAKQTLNSIMRLSPTVGGTDMKQKYEALLKKIK